MRIIAIWLVLGVATLSAATLAATPATRPAEGAVDSSGLDQRPQYKVFDLDVAAGSSATDFLHRLQQAEPAFQYIAQPGPWEKAPLPQMNLRGVTLDQGVALLQKLVDIQVDDAGMGPNSVRIFRGRNRGSGPPTSLSAFGLADSVERIGLRNAWASLAKDQDAPTPEQIAAGRKQALNEVLSVLESAASQADSSYQPSLKLHQETEVLLMRGTPAQVGAVSETLRALQPTTAQFNEYKDRYANLSIKYVMAKRAVNDFKREIDQLARSNHGLDLRNAALERQIMALKKQLQELSGTNDTAGEKH